MEEDEFRCSEEWMCDRRIALRRLFPERKTEPDKKAKGIFMWGNAFHGYLQTELPLLDPLYHSPEHEIKKMFFTDDDYGYFVKGHVDLLYGEKDLIEMKSINPWAMGHILDRGQPNDHHIEQANYMCGFFEDPRNPTILYGSKELNSKCPNIFYTMPLEYNRRRYKMGVLKMDEIYKCLVEGNNPKGLPHTSKTWECAYCEMRGICKELGLQPSKTDINKT